jgi:HEAT repeat protein
MRTVHLLVLALGAVWPGADPGPPVKADPAQLREMLRDRQHPLRQSQAALLLIQHPAPEAEQIIRWGLKQTESPDIFVALADAVRLCRDARFAEELAGALTNGSASIRQAAAEGLAALSGPELIRRLRAIAEDSRADLATRQAAILALGRGGRRLAVIALLDLLSNENETLRRAAAAALGDLTGENYGLDLEKWRKWWEQHKNQSEEHWLEERLAYQSTRSMRLESDLERARAQIVRLHQLLYARLPPEERLRHVQSAGESEDAVVRGLAVAWAAELLTTADTAGQQCLTDLLLALSRDGSMDVQRAAVLALGRVSDARVMQRLQLLLSQGAVPIRAAAVRGLAQQAMVLGPAGEDLRKQIVPLLQQALRDPALEVVIEAAEDLGSLGVAEAGPVLTGLLRHSSEPVRQAAAQALERVADPAVFDPVIAALGDTSARVRFSLVGALGHAAGDGRRLTASQRELLVSRLESLLLRDADPGVRSRAATVLGECGLPSILPTLWKRVVAAEDNRVQQKAWDAVIDVLTRTADFQLVQEWDRKLAESGQGARRVQLLSELLARWQKREDARVLVTATEELLIPLQLDQGKWSAALPLVRDLLTQPAADADLTRRLRWLLAAGELAVREGNPAEARRVVQDAEPFLTGRESLSGEFQKLDKLAVSRDR